MTAADPWAEMTREEMRDRLVEIAGWHSRAACFRCEARGEEVHIECNVCVMCWPCPTYVLATGMRTAPR